MDLEDSNNSEGYLLEVANTILALLNSSAKIENEEELFSDEFYILVTSPLIQEQELKLKPGKTSEKKIENLSSLLNYLSSMLEAELPEVDVKSIILNHDRKNTKDLLELLCSLIQTIIKANLEQMGEDFELDDNEEFKSHSFNENKLNLSDKKPNEKMKLNKEEEIDLENLESLRLGKEKTKKINSDKKENENEDKQKQNPIIEDKDSLKEININNEKKINDDFMKQSSDKPLENEDVDMVENINNLKEKEVGNINLYNDSNDMKVNHLSDSEKKSSLKKSNEIPNLLDVEENSEFQKAKKQFEDIRISDRDNSELGINYSEQQKAYSVPQTQQKLNLPNSSEENELENDFDYNFNGDKKSKKEDSIITNSNHIDQNKSNNISNSKSNQKNAEEEKIINKNSSSKKQIESSKKMPSNKKDKNEKKIISKENNENSEKLNDKIEELEGIQGGDQGEKNEREENQINYEQKNFHTNEEENGESPLIEDGYKNEIMKEIKKIYGDKLDNIFLKHNLENSRNTFQLALRNIKLAKQKMMKIGNRIPEADDLKTKEYILRYEKKMQMMEANYNREQKKLNFFEERAINNFKQNIKDMKKAKEIEAKKTENEIERRRKAQEVRNHHNQIKFCNEIYQKALRLEKEKNLEKIKKKREKNRKENEEKRLAMERIENYYKDQIRLLKEILENEKRQKEIEHRAHIQMLSKLEKEKKIEFKKELDNIFDRFDQEEKKNEFERKNKKELAKIFDSYYGSK